MDKHNLENENSNLIGILREIKDWGLTTIDTLMPLGYMVIKAYLTTSAIAEFNFHKEYDLINVNLPDAIKYLLGAYGYSSAFIAESLRFFAIDDYHWENIGKPRKPMIGLLPIEIPIIKRIYNNIKRKNPE